MRVFCIIFVAILQLVLATTIPADEPKIQPKVVGGTTINIRQAPYQVSVRLTAREKRSYGSGHICGGVVISQRLIATAAHCIYNSDTKAYRKAGEFILVMGSSYLQSSDENTLQYYVQEVIVHPNYAQETLVNDIALLFFNGYIPWSSATVKALPLNTRALATGTVCSVTGWGVTKSGGTVASNALQLGAVPLVSYTECELAYESIPRSQLCAGYRAGGIDACQGDSGGPLQCNDTLSGIVSYGYKCAVALNPGVYTNVSYYNGWVIETNRTLNYSLYKNGGAGLKLHGVFFAILGIFMAAQQ